MSRKIKEIILSILSSRRKLTYLILLATLIIVIPVLAEYTGPTRTVEEKQCQEIKVIDGCNYTGNNGCTLYVAGCTSQPGKEQWDQYCGYRPTSTTMSQVYHWEEDCKWVTVAAPPATVNGNVTCTNGTNGWCRSDALLNINGEDPNPANSIIAIEGTRNGTDFACASDTCQIDATGNGTYAFEYWAVSSHGDTSYKGNTIISVDKENPEINLSVSGSMGYNNWYVSDVKWSTTVTDNISGPSHADITVDGSAQANPSSYGADGTHTIQATGYDIAGNNVQTQQTVSIDQTNPIPTYALSGSLGSNNWYISDVAWTGTATDATSGINAIQVQVDGGVVNNPASIAANGSHTIQVTAQDLAGNIASTSGSFQIDQEMPALNLNLSGTAGQNGWYISPVSWTSSASDAVSGLSNHTLTLNSAPTTADGNTSSDGTYTLNAIAQDNASNQTTQTKNFGIDQTAPTVSFSPLSGTYSDSVALSGSSADDTSGVAYIEIQVAGQTHQVPATGDWSLNWNTKSTCNGDVTATVRAFDQAGHASAPQSQSFTIHNQSVTIILPSQIDASQPVPLGINPSNISRMTVRITDDAGKLPAISQTYTGASIPSNYKWDRYMGDGSLAPKGTYTLNVLIQDKNTCVEDAASITLVVSDSKFSAWVSGAPTNTPAPIYPTSTPLPSPTLESTATQPAIAANTESSSPTEAPTNTPTPVVVAFLSPKAEQKTTTTTNGSPKAPTSTSGATTDDTASTLSTGTLIGSAAAGLIGSIAAYQAAKEAERKRREEEARKRAEDLMHQRNKLIKEGIDPTGMNTKEISKLTEKIDKANKARDAYIYNSVIASVGDPEMSIEDARAIFTNSSIKKNDGENLTEQDINKRVDYAIDYQEKMRKQEEALAEFMAIEIAKEEYRLEQEAKQLKELENQNQNQNTQETGRVITKPLSKGKQAQIDALEQRDDFNHEYYEKMIDKGSEAYKQGEATAINIALETFRKKQQRKNNQANPVSAGKQAQIDALEQRNDFNANSIDNINKLSFKNKNGGTKVLYSLSNKNYKNEDNPNFFQKIINGIVNFFKPEQKSQEEIDREAQLIANQVLDSMGIQNPNFKPYILGNIVNPKNNKDLLDRLINKGIVSEDQIEMDRVNKFNLEHPNIAAGPEFFMEGMKPLDEENTTIVMGKNKDGKEIVVYYEEDRYDSALEQLEYAMTLFKNSKINVNEEVKLSTVFNDIFYKESTGIAQFEAAKEIANNKDYDIGYEIYRILLENYGVTIEVKDGRKVSELGIENIAESTVFIADDIKSGVLLRTNIINTAHYGDIEYIEKITNMDPSSIFILTHGNVTFVFNKDADLDGNCITEGDTITCKSYMTTPNSLHELGHIFDKYYSTKFGDILPSSSLVDETIERSPVGYISGYDSMEHPPIGTLKDTAYEKTEEWADMFLNYILNGKDYKIEKGNKIITYGFTDEEPNGYYMSLADGQNTRSNWMFINFYQFCEDLVSYEYK